MNNDQTSVDVVIPSYRPDEKFSRLMKKLQEQEYPIGTIFVINTKAGRFPKEVEQMEKVKVSHIERREFDHGATRDMGMQMSKAEIVVFMTQDAVPADEYVIGNLVKVLEEDEMTGAAYARQLAASDCNYIEKYIRKFNYPENSRIKSKEDLQEMGIKTFFCSNVCAAYKRNIYEKAGGFCKKTIFNEDMILAGHMINAGYKVAYVAEARVIHSHNYTGMQQFLKNPQAADNLLDAVTKQIGTLSDFPQNFRLVDDPVLASWKIRFVTINNYLAFYTIDEEKQTVIVVRFLYQKSNWCSILRQGFTLV